MFALAELLTLHSLVRSLFVTLHVVLSSREFSAMSSYALKAHLNKFNLMFGVLIIKYVKLQHARHMLQ